MDQFIGPRPRPQLTNAFTPQSSANGPIELLIGRAARSRSPYSEPSKRDHRRALDYFRRGIDKNIHPGKGRDISNRSGSGLASKELGGTFHRNEIANVIERRFNKIQGFRRVTARY